MKEQPSYVEMMTNAKLTQCHAQKLNYLLYNHLIYSKNRYAHGRKNCKKICH